MTSLSFATPRQNSASGGLLAVQTALVLGCLVLGFDAVAAVAAPIEEVALRPILEPVDNPAGRSLPVALTPTRYDFFEVARGQVSGTVVTWRTVYERGVVGFDLYREVGNGLWFLVNRALINSSNELAGAVYRIGDPSAPQLFLLTYKLVEWYDTPTPFEYGPLTLRVTSTPAPLPALSPAPDPALTRALRSVITDSAPPAVGTNGPRYVKLLTTRAGLHYVRADTVAGLLGQSLGTVRQWITNGSVGLYCQGQSVGYIPAGDGNSFFFQANEYKDNYTSTNVYWLTGLTNPPVRYVAGGSPTPVTGIFDKAIVTRDTNGIVRSTITSDPFADYWFWKNTLSGSLGFNTTTEQIPLTQVVTNAATTARISVLAQSSAATNNQLTVSVNGVAVGSNAWFGPMIRSMEFTFSPALLKNATNAILLAAALYRNSTIYINKLELQYPRTYRATGGMLEFTANENPTITADGFTNAAVAVLEVTDASRPAVVAGFSVSGSGTNYAISVATTNPAARFAAFLPTATLPQPLASAVTLAGLAAETNAADFVLITTPAMASAAEELAIYRRSQGLRSRVVTVDSIYDEFNNGLPSPYALRSLLSYAWTNWQTRPRYAALVGDGSFDYRNILGYNGMQVPTLMLPTAVGGGLYGSDIMLGDVNGDGLPEVAIGRLPVRNAGQLQVQVAKIKAYEAGGIRPDPKALLIADWSDGAGNFIEEMQLTSAAISNKYSRTHVYPDTLEVMRAGITNGMNAGTDLMVYFGHGAIDRFGQAGYLIVSNIVTLTNGGRLPVVSVLTCVAGEYSATGNNCIGEELVLATNRGAIAVIAPTGLSANYDASLLNQRLMRVLCTQNWGRLGDFWRQAASDYAYYDSSAGREMGVSIYNLIGDPTLIYSVTRDAPPPRRK